MEDLKKYIRSIENFPENGIIFRDITTVIQNPKSLEDSINLMQEKLKDVDFDYIVAPESRGFIFGMPIAYNMKKGFIPVRKKGKLPAETIEETYNLEYGTATLEIHNDSLKQGDKVVIIDDLLATGGTIEAIVKLVERLGGKVQRICTLIELPELLGREKLKNYSIETLICFEGK